jgi:hypothetical protein
MNTYGGELIFDHMGYFVFLQWIVFEKFGKVKFDLHLKYEI